MKRRYPQLSEHDTARAHRGIAPRFPTLSADCPRPCPGDLWIWYPFFHIFLFSIPFTRYAGYVPGGEKDTLFTCFYLRGWCTGPKETSPREKNISFFISFLFCQFPCCSSSQIVFKKWQFVAHFERFASTPDFHDFFLQMATNTQENTCKVLEVNGFQLRNEEWKCNPDFFY